MWFVLYWFPVLAMIAGVTWIAFEVRGLRDDHDQRDELAYETLTICRKCGTPIYYARGYECWWNRYAVRPGFPQCEHVPVGVDRADLAPVPDLEKDRRNEI